MDGCSTGIAGVVSQGEDWKNAYVAAFYSAKLNSAQRNYPTHEIEMLAGVETMLRHKDVLQGVHFKWVTDHKGLTYLLNQKNISGRQARWLEKISSFVFEVVYAAGSENILADALSRMYSNDSEGTKRTVAEYVYHDVSDNDTAISAYDTPLLAGINAVVATHCDTPTRGGEHPETSKEFACRMRNKFVLKGPRKQMEGRYTTGDPEIEENIAEASGSSFLIGSDAKEAPASLPEVILESSAGIDLIKEIKGRYAEDSVFKLVMEHPKSFRNFEVKGDLIYIKIEGKELLCVPKILINGRSIYELIISEAHSILAHLGAIKTLHYIRDYMWWKNMVFDTKVYCDTCITCKRSKPSNQKPYGLLNPLSVPSEPWESIGMDFVGLLPLSGNRDGSFDSITVIICLLTAMVELILSRINYTAQDLAELMFENVYKHHGLPKNIISDRDVLFTSNFWEHLYKLIGTTLKMSSAYHPQTDGSTERANRTVTQMLRQCISLDQKDWVGKLPTIQFAINSACSASTGYAPFFLNNGRMPRAMIWNSAEPTEYPNIRVFAQKKKLALMSAHDSIIAARVKQTRDAN